MTDEQAVRASLYAASKDPANLSYVQSTTESALALLDAKDAELREYKEALAFTVSERDTALSRAEQAEAALAEERKKHQAFREEVSNFALVLRGEAGGFTSLPDLQEFASRFILPAKPAVDPLVAVLKECDDDPTDTWAKALAANLRAAIERAGGVKAVFGEGSDYDNLPQCIKSTEFTAGRQAGGTISFEGEG